MFQKHISKLALTSHIDFFFPMRSLQGISTVGTEKAAYILQSGTTLDPSERNIINNYSSFFNKNIGFINHNNNIWEIIKMWDHKKLTINIHFVSYVTHASSICFYVKLCYYTY